MAEFPIWEWFIQSVEGQPASMPMTIENGRPTFSAKSGSVESFGYRVPLMFQTAPKPDIRPVVEVLRSPATIPAIVRRWLADLLDENSDSDFALVFRGRKRGAPDLSRIIDALCSEQPIAADLRFALADLLSAGPTDYQRLEFRRRRTGAPNKSGVANWEAAELVENLIERGEKYGAAVAEAARHFDLGESTVKAAVSSLKAARMRDDDERRADLEARD